jgi:O-antigen ligase
MLQWVAYCLMTVSLAAAVMLKGGVYPAQWEWSALGVSLAACLAVFSGSARDNTRGRSWDLGLMGLFLGWISLQLVPLPPGLVAHLSPLRWKVVSAARAAIGQDSSAWVALSVAPAASMQRLLDFLPAMAAFVAAREMGMRWCGRLWLVVAPVLAIAWLESLLGLTQFYLMRSAGGDAASATGTYVNRNHFAGLLEMAFPLALFAAVCIWRRGINSAKRPAGPALRASGLLIIAACLLAGIIVSLSRMGFLSTLASFGLTAFCLLASCRASEFNWRSRWLWVVPILVPLCILFLSTKEMVLRFAEIAAEDISKDTRMQIWNDTTHIIGAYKWTGCGLGAYEHCLYQFKTAAPINTVDFAHNDYLQILSEVGLPCGIVVAVIAGWILWRTVSVVLFIRGGRNWELAVGLLGTFLAIGLHSLADFNLYIPANALVLAWLGGVAVSATLRET